jgi:nucleoside-diphosphate-sugar epimerase/intein/homing endonuclease
MPTTVVTGGAGFLGSHLCEFLLARDHRVICIDNLDTGTLENIDHIRDENFVFTNQDIVEPVHVDEPVDFVYHLASPASPIDYARLPLHTLKVGSYGTHHMLGVAKFKRARILVASTSEVYGDPEIHPQPEDYWGNVNPIGPRGVYDEAKRYAEAMTMAYHRQQGVNTCISRTFNSVLADEQILYDDGRELRRETAAELAAKLMRSALPARYVGSGHSSVALLEPQPALDCPLDGYTVPAFGAGGQVVSSEAVSFIGHPTEQRCYRVTTRYGRSIKVTGDHSLFVEGANGEPTAKPVNDLQPGERIALGARIQVPERDRTVVSPIEAWRYAEEDIWDLSVEAEGLGNAAWEKRFDAFGLLVSKRRNKGPNWRNGAWTKLIRMRQTNRVPLPVFWSLGLSLDELPDVKLRTKGAGRPFPLQVEISDDLLWLLGLFVAEGCSYEQGTKSSFISISCDESTLDRVEQVIGDVFGLHVVRSKGNRTRGPAVFIHSKLLLRVLAFLGFEENQKRIPGWILGMPLSRLKWFIEGYREGDGVHSGEKFEAGILHEFSTVHEELKDDLVVAFARFGLLPSVGRYETTLRQKTGDRRYPFWRVSLYNVSPWSPLEWDQGVEQRLNVRRHGDLVWAPVKEIEEVPATELVFDFSVPGPENFWAGTGVMAHNTYGSRMRAHDGRAIPTFLRQALQDKPLTVFGDGSQTRSFCYVDDQIRGLVALAESDVHLPVNIGNQDEYTLLQLAEAVIEVTGARSEIVFEPLPVDDPKIRQPDITRAKDLLGWEPQVSLQEGLKKTIDEAGVERLVGQPG